MQLCFLLDLSFACDISFWFVNKLFHGFRYSALDENKKVEALQSWEVKWNKFIKNTVNDIDYVNVVG